MGNKLLKCKWILSYHLLVQERSRERHKHPVTLPTAREVSVILSKGGGGAICLLLPTRGGLPTGGEGSAYKGAASWRPPPPVVTCSGGHCRGRCAIYWGAF